jgi:hypothetical protein
MVCVEGQLIPPVLPALAPVDLRALASQLPDLSNLGSLTVNIQTNNMTPATENAEHIHALAVDTNTRLGHLRHEIKQTLEQGNATIAERFRMIGGWCQEVYSC